MPLSTSYNNKLILFIIVILTPLSGMGVDIVAPSLPYMSKVMDSSESIISLTVSAYVFGYGVSQIFFGVISDVFGRKKPIIFSLVSFAIVSMLIPFSLSVEELLAYRFLQGVTVAGSTALARSVVTDVFSPQERKNVSNYLVIAWGAGPIVAPLIGAYLQELFNWGASFNFLAIYSLISVILAMLLLPETNNNKVSSIKKSVVNVFYLMKDKEFILSATIAGLCLSFLYSFNVFSSYVLIDRHGYSTIEYGNVLIFVGSAWLVGSFTNRLLLSKMDDRTVQNRSVFIAFFISVAIYSFNDLGLNLVISYIIPSFFVIFCVNIVFTRNFAICLGLHPDKAGVAGAMTGTVFIVVSSLTMSFVSFFKIEGVRQMSVIFLLVVLAISALLSLRHWLSIQRDFAEEV